MKDLLTGIAAVVTAGAAIYAFVFQQIFADTTELQKKIATKKKVDAPAAKLLAQKRRGRQIGALCAVLVVAFVLNIAALLVDDDPADCRAACPPAQSTAPP